MNPTTGPVGGNQEKIDELEYFIEFVGRSLFGGEGEDFRRLHEYVPRTRNLSALLDLFSAGGPRDVAEDLRYLQAELEVRAGQGAGGSAFVFREDQAVFRYSGYTEMVSHPETRLEQVKLEDRMEVAELLARDDGAFGSMLARVNAYAWLCVVGLPDLEAELKSDELARIGLEEWGLPMMMGLGRLLQATEYDVGRGLSAYYELALRFLYDEYKGQLARYASRG